MRSRAIYLSKGNEMRKEPKPSIAPPKKVFPRIFWYHCITCEDLIKREWVWRYSHWTVCLKCSPTPEKVIERVEYFKKYQLQIEDNS